MLDQLVCKLKMMECLARRVIQRFISAGTLAPFQCHCRWQLRLAPSHSLKRRDIGTDNWCIAVNKLQILDDLGPVRLAHILVREYSAKRITQPAIDTLSHVPSCVVRRRELMFCREHLHDVTQSFIAEFRTVVREYGITRALLKQHLLDISRCHFRRRLAVDRNKIYKMR